jgi:hypothetical protein
MNRRVTWSAIAATAALSLTAFNPTSASAARCVSGQDVRQQVSTFVHSLRDDVKSQAVRKDVKAALVETAKTVQGVKADTNKERRGLGVEISALARQLKDQENRVDRAALITQIHALQEQKRTDRVTAEDVTELKRDVKRLDRRLVAKTDTRAEARQVAQWARDFMAQFDC